MSLASTNSYETLRAASKSQPPCGRSESPRYQQQPTLDSYWPFVFEGAQYNRYVQAMQAHMNEQTIVWIDLNGLCCVQGHIQTIVVYYTHSYFTEDSTQLNILYVECHHEC